MLGDQGLFSQVISWDSHYTDFYSLRGAQEEWATASSCLQSHSKEFGPLKIKHFPINGTHLVLFLKREKITDTMKSLFFHLRMMLK